MTISILDWATVFGSGVSPADTTIGRTEISFATSPASGGAPATQSSLVSDLELGANTDGHLRLAMDADDLGEGFVQSISFRNTDFPPFGVEEVRFDLLGVDENSASDQVQIRAFDFSGTALPQDAVALTTSGTVSITNDTADGETPVAVDSTDGNVAVVVSGGDIARIDIIYTSGPEALGNPAEQFIGVGPLTITSPTIFDDTDGSDNGVILGTDDADLIFGGTEANGGILSGAGINASGADNDTTFPDDTINGLGGADRIYGGAGADVVQGNTGDDTIFGGAGANVLSGNTGNDFIFGGSDAETISGGANDDSLFGGGGTDVIEGNQGSDGIFLSASEASSIGAVRGGADTDTLQITFRDTLSTADLRLNEISGIEFFAFDAGNDDATIEALDAQVSGLRSVFFDAIGSNTEVFSITMDTQTVLNLNSVGLSNFETGDFVRVTGDGDAEAITGTFGADSISGEGGADNLSGGAGDDILDGGAGSDAIDGEENDDTIRASAGNDTIAGGDDQDTYDASLAVEQLFLSVASNGDGTAQKSLLAGGTGTDDVSGIEHFIANETGGGADVLSVTNLVRAEDIQGVSDDAFGTFTSTGGNDTSFGPSEDYQLSHILSGTSPDDTLPVVGPLGHYEIVGGDEAGQIGDVGFENFETFSFTVSSGVVDGLDIGELMDSGLDVFGSPTGPQYVDADGDAITSGDDSILGNGGDDTIGAGRGADTVDGGADKDLIDGGEGMDSLSGGPGDDTISGTGTTFFQDVFLDGGADTDTLFISPFLNEFVDFTGTTIQNFEALEYTGGSRLGAFRISFTDAQITGNFDTIAIETSASDATTLFVDVTSGATTIDLSAKTLIGFAGDDVVEIIGTGADENITGTSANDSIEGGAGNDTLNGSAGDETLIGGDNDDLIEGGAGADNMDGGDGTDGLSYLGASTGVTVDLSAGSSTLAGDTEGDSFVNFENLFGSNQADVLTGDTGDNVIGGNGGADLLDGAGGNDTLLGGAGNDTLVAQANDPWLNAVYDGGSEDDQLALSGGTTALKGSTIANVETLSFAESGSDITAELTPDQLEAFDAVVTDAGRSGVDHRIDVDMGDDTVADLSGISFTNFDQPGDGVFILGDGDVEIITGSSVNDVIAGGGGDDTLMGGGGDDVFGAFTGSAKIDGGADKDIYDSAFVDAVDVSVDDTGSGTVSKNFESDPSGTDTVDNIETFVAGENADEADAITFDTAVSQEDVPTAIQGISDDAFGVFVPEDGSGPTAFGPLEDYAITDILAGTSPDGALPAVGPVGDFEIMGGDEVGQIGAISYENFEEISFAVQSPELIVENDTARTDEDTSVDITPLDNDTGIGLGLVSASAANGSVVLLSETELRYTPDPDFFGEDTINYIVGDDFDQSTGGEIAVTVDPVNDAPVANDDTATTARDTEVFIDALSNDTDVDGDPLSIISAMAGNGMVEITPDSQLSYTPNSGFIGDDVITYLASDGAESDEGTVSITVSAQSDAGDDGGTFDDFAWAAMLLLLLGLAASGVG